MGGEFETAFGRVRWEVDEDGLWITHSRRVRQVHWQEITRAGLVRLSDPNVPDNFPTQILPGLGTLFDLNRSLAEDYQQLVLARGRSPFRAYRVPIPIAKASALALVEEVRKRVGERWVGEISMAGHTRALGLSNPWWFYPIFVMSFLGVGLLVLLAGGAYTALTTGSLADVPLVAWLALVLWLVLVGLLFFLLRRRMEAGSFGSGR
ncbi:MAG TPA: hypothetical protein DEP84_07320 [Chloroflexi bacterium]|nr:hypothetical protein [Chloroflexota bacterium]